MVLGPGRLTQDWFLESFLELGDDLHEALSGKKQLAILWEQEGCPYCREMHMVNFAIPEIHNYVKQHFAIVQLDIWGARDVKDFSGATVSERKLAKRWGIRATPTIQFITDDEKAAAGDKVKQFEVARMPGYLRPLHFLWMFEYVGDRAYLKSDFQTFVQDKVAGYRARKEPFPEWS